MSVRIVKPVGVQPDELELQVAQYIQDLSTVTDLKQDLVGLQFHSAKQVYNS